MIKLIIILMFLINIIYNINSNNIKNESIEVINNNINIPIMITGGL